MPKTSYSEEIAEAVCDRVAAGATIVSLEKEEGFPSRRTIQRWMNDNEEFRVQLQNAIELRADYWAEQIQIISHDDKNDTIEVVTDEGQLKIFPNTAKIQRDRLKVDSLKWLAQKLYRKRYGDHQEIEHKGELKNVTPVLNVTIGGNQSRLASETGNSSEDQGE